ncbi:MAG: TonB family protein [Bacteroidaceae bacterium]|mgnify:FL=1|nr:TonB family protein [Bacteroidaceae bacterium]
MSQIDLIQGKWCDIIFEGKNKEYGAYPLRKGTGKRNVIAIVSVIALIVLCLVGIEALNAYDEYQKRQEAIMAELELSKLQEKKQPEKKKEEVEKVIKQPEQKVVEVKQNTIKFTEPVIKKDDEVKEENTLLNMEDLNKDNRRTADESYDQGTNQRQEDYGALTIEEEKVAPPPPPAPEPEPEVKVEENKVYDVVEQQPTFNGNINQWLASNLKYPPVAAENGIEGRVIVQFVVGKDGSIHSAQVVRGVDASLDKEALRVVNSMPKWVPGKQNGQSVNCKFTLPVVFRLQ